MKKYLSLIADLAIIVFTGSCVGILDTIVSNYNPKMINILTIDIIYSLFIGGTSRFLFILLTHRKQKVSLRTVFFVLTLVLILGFTITFIISSTKNIYKTGSIFLTVLFIVLYLGYTQYMFEIKINDLLCKKKQQLSERLK